LLKSPARAGGRRSNERRKTLTGIQPPGLEAIVHRT
jgi:hypothetical protein